MALISDATAPSTPPPDLEPLQLERDPLSPDYDARKLFGAIGGNVMEFFAAEPRDESWAPEREDDLKRLALPRLREVDPDAKMDVECHTGVCRVSVHSGKDALTRELDSYPLTCLANTTVPMWGNSADDGSGSGAADPYSDFYLLFGKETRSRDGMLAANEDRCARYRDQWLQRVLGGNRGAP